MTKQFGKRLGDEHGYVAFHGRRRTGCRVTTNGGVTLTLKLLEPLQLPYAFEVVCEATATLHRCEVKLQNGSEAVAMIINSETFDESARVHFADSTASRLDEHAQWAGFRPARGFKRW